MIRPLLRRLLRGSTATMVRALPPGLASRLLRADTRDYRQTWIEPVGIPYRRAVYERQRADGAKPLLDNPTADEIAAALRAAGAKRVLEVGCGWGRLMALLGPQFEISGCDVSDDMLKLVPKGLDAFHLDVAVESLDFVRQNAGRWDACFTRGVMLYFMRDRIACAYALNNMLALAAGQVHCWEWPEVCETLRCFSASDRLVLHPIEHRDE